MTIIKSATGKDIFAEKIKSFALSVGADLVGIAPAEHDRVDEKRLRDFVKSARHADMDWLTNITLRTDPRMLLPDAKSAIVIAVNYYTPNPPLPSGYGRVARYARGRDYHKVIKNILKKIAAFIKANRPEARSKICVDSSPLLEKSYAVKAGLGFIGKNTTLITPQFGSFVLLGVLITTLKLSPDQASSGTCGTCARCLNSCPTKALIAAGTMDARRCVAYLTIENKGEIPAEFTGKIAPYIFGCDTCQEVCPYNLTRAKPAKNRDLLKQIAGPAISLAEILKMRNDQQYLRRFAGSPLMRAKRKGLQRNARFIQKKIFPL
jgi:epoxyqueuosine reductase